MTQIKEGLTKNPSPELLSLIKAAAQSLLGFGELWTSIKKKGHDEGFSEKELQNILRPLLKPQLTKDQIYYLFNAETKIEKVKDYQSHRKFPTDDAKKEPEQSPIPPKQLPNTPPKDPEPEDEEPTPLELAQIEIQQLKDALKKTDQFKPANQLTEEQARDMTMEAVKQTGLAVPLPNEDSIFDWLEKRDNGVNCYWYPNYGIELFRNRILTQLKNKGVTTFKRLYFEV